VTTRSRGIGKGGGVWRGNRSSGAQDRFGDEDDEEDKEDEGRDGVKYTGANCVGSLGAREGP
jgi:hypothetical protein